MERGSSPEDRVEIWNKKIVDRKKICKFKTRKNGKT
jgi:hypothetical protein